LKIPSGVGLIPSRMSYTALMQVGVLAFQGDVLEHIQALHTLGAEAVEVRSVADLESVQRLIIPGGESTVMSKFLDETGLRGAIIERSEKGNFPIYGTCAGAILLAKDVSSNGVPEKRVKPLMLMDIAIERNAYGRQTESFVDAVTKAIFIRAPKVLKFGPTVRVLSEHGGYPVAYIQGVLLASTFHPELAGGASFLHRLFLTL